ncbi:hypothetical protein DAPPUDRAFT_234710 [Daphnia pulex]|uniref:Uncharacterized protein n=2 Tax=Daphnia TaxID=6668 RepID=E9FX89_DAPPU|nr:hypothetical protein DAPPUDRAFT_234710 [Daphnia pulex]|eukprot:EFX88309.1 hypothetical protein DAPPUDRAFT_234710 [Daphnia pulex]
MNKTQFYVILGVVVGLLLLLLLVFTILAITYARRRNNVPLLPLTQAPSENSYGSQERRVRGLLRTPLRGY